MRMQYRVGSCVSPAHCESCFKRVEKLIRDDSGTQYVAERKRQAQCSLQLINYIPPMAESRLALSKLTCRMKQLRAIRMATLEAVCHASEGSVHAVDLMAAAGEVQREEGKHALESEYE
jgi:hypothetical protein